MHPRAVLNFIYVYLLPGKDAEEGAREKFDNDLYDDGTGERVSIITQMGL